MLDFLTIKRFKLSLDDSIVPFTITFIYFIFFVDTSRLRTEDSWVQIRYDSQLHQWPISCGGGTRTHVVRLMRPSWNHLQSTPQFFITPNSVYLVLPTGLEPVTPSLKVRCSKPTELREIVEVLLRFELRTLDYKSSVLPTKLQNLIVTRMGFEPMIFSVKGKRLKPLVQRA